MFALVDDEEFEELSKYSWQVVKAPKATALFYAVRNNPNGKPFRIQMHNHIMKLEKGFIVDHLNGNGLDNRKANFRICTEKENCYNKPSRGGSSIYKGVYYQKSVNKWASQLKKDYKTYKLGYYENEIEAALAYDKLAREFYGNTVRLNFPEENELPSAVYTNNVSTDLEKWNASFIKRNEILSNENQPKLRGFALLTPEQRKLNASAGGRAVPAHKRAFSLNSKLASEAGTKGGSNGHGGGRPKKVAEND